MSLVLVLVGCLLELTQLSDRAEQLTPYKRGFFCQVSELDQLMEESELHAAGKEEEPIRLRGTKARREVTRDPFTGSKDKKKREREWAPTQRAQVF